MSRSQEKIHPDSNYKMTQRIDIRLYPGNSAYYATVYILCIFWVLLYFPEHVFLNFGFAVSEPG